MQIRDTPASTAAPPLARRWRWERVLVAIEGLVTAWFLVALLVLVASQVVTRYFLQSPPVWTEEFARYALVWLTFVGAAYLASRRRHLTVAALDRWLGPRALAWVVATSSAVTAVLSGLLVWASADFLERVSRQHTAAGGLPMSYVYGALAVGLLLVALHSVCSVWRDLSLLLRGQVPEVRPEDSISEGGSV